MVGSMGLIEDGVSVSHPVEMRIQRADTESKYDGERFFFDFIMGVLLNDGTLKVKKEDQSRSSSLQTPVL